VIAFPTQFIARQHSKIQAASYRAELNSLGMYSQQAAGELHSAFLVIELFSSRPEPFPGYVEGHRRPFLAVRRPRTILPQPGRARIGLRDQPPQIVPALRDGETLMAGKFAD
jgi:hypothetical protein